MADLAQLLAQLYGRREEEGAPPPRRRGLFGARIDPQVTARLGQDFQGDGLGQAATDFQSGFNDMAVSARQALPRGAITAMSESDIPGWQGLAQQRSFADATQAGLTPPAQLPAMQGAPLQSVMQPGYADEVSGPPTPIFPRRGVEPPDAPAGPRWADVENERFNRGVELARAAIQNEREYDMQRLPRPGQPLIAQAWADDHGSRLGAIAGVRGAQGRRTRRDGR